MNQQLTITVNGVNLNVVLNDTDTSYLIQYRCSYFRENLKRYRYGRTPVFPIQVSPKMKFTLTNLPKMFKTRILFRLHTREVECCNGNAKNILAQSIDCKVLIAYCTWQYKINAYVNFTYL